MSRENWMVSTSITLPQDDLDNLEKLKLNKRESRSSVIRRLIQAASIQHQEQTQEQGQPIQAA